MLSTEYTTVDGTATTAGGDYTSSSGTVRFNKDDTVKVIDIGILDDDVPEADEFIIFRIMNGAQTTGCRIQIVNDDHEVTTKNPVQGTTGN